MPPTDPDGGARESNDYGRPGEYRRKWSRLAVFVGAVVAILIVAPVVVVNLLSLPGAASAGGPTRIIDVQNKVALAAAGLAASQSHVVCSARNARIEQATVAREALKLRRSERDQSGAARTPRRSPR